MQLGLLHMKLICSCLFDQLYFFETAVRATNTSALTHAGTNTSVGKMN